MDILYNARSTLSWIPNYFAACITVTLHERHGRWAVRLKFTPANIKEIIRPALWKESISDRWIPSQRASSVKSVSILCRKYDKISKLGKFARPETCENYLGLVNSRVSYARRHASLIMGAECLSIVFWSVKTISG